MEYDEKLIEEAVLALLTTFSFDNGNSWKGHDFQIMNRLHEQGFISEQKQVHLADAGRLGTGPANRRSVICRNP